MLNLPQTGGAAVAPPIVPMPGTPGNGAQGDAAAAAAASVIEAGQILAARGWVPATSGNLSCRIDADRIAVTASGIDKGSLTPAHILTISLAEPPPKGSSAETALHQLAYRRDPSVNAVLHVHSRSATLISRRIGHGGADDAAVRLRGYELLKAFATIRTHATEIAVPIFANDQDVEALAERVAARLPSFGPTPGFLIEGHGLYAWGRTMAEAHRHLEAFDFLFTCELAQIGVPA
jgi:methylthioribulose-1-phosphate dehydratase